jgi:hypothetical protein
MLTWNIRPNIGNVVRLQRAVLLANGTRTTHGIIVEVFDNGCVLDCGYRCSYTATIADIASVSRVPVSAYLAA